MKTKDYVSIGVAVVLLAACGGGGGDPLPPVTDSVPADASAAGMTNWLTQVAATAPEEREPLDVASFAPPQPDDTEPDALK